MEKSITDSTTAADLVFRALADPGRRRLLDRLRVRGGLTLSALCEGMPMSRQAVTKHLLQLEEASLVVTRWVGREKEHYLNPVPIHDIAKRWIRPFEHHRLDSRCEMQLEPFKGAVKLTITHTMDRPKSKTINLSQRFGDIN